MLFENILPHALHSLRRFDGEFSEKRLPYLSGKQLAEL